MGATPVFADIEDETYNLDPAAVEAAITPRTRASSPCTCSATRPRCRRCARSRAPRARGARGRGAGLRRRARRRARGAIGDAATFSFFPTKNLPCFGDGGLVTTPSAEVIGPAACCASTAPGQARLHAVGYNSRLDKIQAAILLELLPLLDGWNDGRIAAAARYAELGLGELVTLPAVAPGARHVYHLYVVRSQHRDGCRRPDASAASRARLLRQGRCTCSRPSPTSATPEGSLPVTERLAREPGPADVADARRGRAGRGRRSRRGTAVPPGHRIPRYGAAEPPPAVAGRRRRAPGGHRVVCHLQVGFQIGATRAGTLLEADDPDRDRDQARCWPRSAPTTSGGATSRCAISTPCCAPWGSRRSCC